MEPYLNNKDKHGVSWLRFGFVKTVATYAGLHPDTARQALKMLETYEIIKYGRTAKRGTWFALQKFKHRRMKFDEKNT